MIVTFCGHSDFSATDEYEQTLLAVLARLIGDGAADFYLGGYGNFDRFAYACCKKFKMFNPRVRLIYVTPYLDRERPDGYDESLYPPLERVPPRFAITHRNRYMAEAADCIIAYVTRSHGGAYETLTHAKRKGKPIPLLTD